MSSSLSDFLTWNPVNFFRRYRRELCRTVKGCVVDEANLVTLDLLDSRRLTASVVLDYPETAGGETSDLTITVTGAAEGDPVMLGVPATAMFDKTFYIAWVSSANTVMVRFINNALIAINPPSATFKVVVSKF